LSSINLNERALRLIRRMTMDQSVLGVSVKILTNGATVVDAGINVPGSLEAGRLFSEVCLGGVGSVQFSEVDIAGQPFAGVNVSVDLPKLGCMASQYAGWALSLDDDGSGGSFFAMGSGPARALYASEPLFEDLKYRETSQVAVLALEGRQMPTEAVAGKVAKACGVEPSSLFMLIAPTASVAGNVQISARVVETGLHKLHELGFDLDVVKSGFGVCPLATIAGDDLKAIGRTNDAMLYGSTAWYVVDCEDEELEKVIPDTPSSSSKDYGELFYDLFKRYNGDFYKIDPMLFSPARVYCNNMRSGRSFHAGDVNLEMLKRSFGL
jgi:methenyltetrahydromethanopterin cyclohydrolase